jgi:hypothetical protein
MNFYHHMMEFHGRHTGDSSHRYFATDPSEWHLAFIPLGSIGKLNCVSRITLRNKFWLEVARTDWCEMLKNRSTTLQRVLVISAGLLILKVTGAVLLKYRDYFPPNFESDFLRGRELYFSGSYRWAFYTHIAAGPITLMLGLVLIGERFRRSFPKWHRYLGRIQALTILFLLAPSGLWMAYRAEAGPVAGLGFATLAIVTGTSITLGWRAAVKRRFAVHRRWMLRCFLLLCSTVVLRLIAGLATVTGIQGGWVEPMAAWVSWLLPLVAFELIDAVNRHLQGTPPQHAPRPERLSSGGLAFGSKQETNPTSVVQKSPTLSCPATEISARRAAAGIVSERNRTLPSHSAACIPPV